VPTTRNRTGTVTVVKTMEMGAMELVVGDSAESRAK
jgi:hypothetical protein